MTFERKSRTIIKTKLMVLSDIMRMRVFKLLRVLKETRFLLLHKSSDGYFITKLLLCLEIARYKH